jgi:hypothetical protein
MVCESRGVRNLLITVRQIQLTKTRDIQQAAKDASDVFLFVSTSRYCLSAFTQRLLGGR